MLWFRCNCAIPWLGHRFGETSVRALARRMGLNHASYKAWEVRGSVPKPLSKLEAALRALEFPDAEAWAAWILTGHGDRPPAPGAAGAQASELAVSSQNGLAILRKVKSGDVEPEAAWTTIKTLLKAGLAGLAALLLAAQPRTASASDTRRSHISRRRSRERGRLKKAA
jgi:hypothetical protein